MSRVGSWMCLFAASLIFAGLAAPGQAAPPMVLAQFFEHFDEREGVPPSEDPAFEGLDLPDIDEGLEGAEPQLRPDGKPGLEGGPPPVSADETKSDRIELGEVPPALDLVNRPEMLADLYDALEKAKSPEAAEPIMDAIEDLWSLSGSDTVDLLMSRAAQFANAAEIELSLAILDAVVDIAPEEAEVWYMRAKVNVLNGKPERALADLRRALSLDAKHYRAIADLGLVLEQLGAKKEALEAYRRALAVNPFLEDAQMGVDALKREVEGQDI